MSNKNPPQLLIHPAMFTNSSPHPKHSKTSQPIAISKIKKINTYCGAISCNSHSTHVVTGKRESDPGEMQNAHKWSLVLGKVTQVMRDYQKVTQVKCINNRKVTWIYDWIFQLLENFCRCQQLLAKDICWLWSILSMITGLKKYGSNSICELIEKLDITA